MTYEDITDEELVELWEDIQADDFLMLQDEL